MFLVPLSRLSRDRSHLVRSFDRLFDDSFERIVANGAAAESDTPRSPALDVAESDLAYTVRLDMPGVAKEDVKVSVEGRQVTVQAHVQRSEEQKEGERVVYRERAASSYARTLSLPMEVDQAEAQAKLEHGVLVLTLPKRGARSAAQISVN